MNDDMKIVDYIIGCMMLLLGILIGLLIASTFYREAFDREAHRKWNLTHTNVVSYETWRTIVR